MDQDTGPCSVELTSQQDQETDSNKTRELSFIKDEKCRGREQARGAVE